MATDNDFEVGGNAAKPTSAELDAEHARQIKVAVNNLNALTQAAAVAGLKTNIDVVTRHHIGAVAAPTVHVDISRQL